MTSESVCAGIVSGVGPAADVPVPVNAIVCVPALSITVMVDVRVPVTVGWKTTVIVHEAPGAIWTPTQSSAVRLKSRPCCGVPLKNTGAVPVSVIVIVCGALVVPSSCDPKATLAGVIDTAGVPVGVGAGTGVPPPPPPPCDASAAGAPHSTATAAAAPISLNILTPLD